MGCKCHKGPKRYEELVPYVKTGHKCNAGKDTNVVRIAFVLRIVSCNITFKVMLHETIRSNDF